MKKYLALLLMMALAAAPVALAEDATRTEKGGEADA